MLASVSRVWNEGEMMEHFLLPEWFFPSLHLTPSSLSSFLPSYLPFLLPPPSLPPFLHPLNTRFRSGLISRPSSYGFEPILKTLLLSSPLPSPPLLLISLTCLSYPDPLSNGLGSRSRVCGIQRYAAGAVVAFPFSGCGVSLGGVSGQCGAGM